MSDEGTDINRNDNLCICIRYCDRFTTKNIDLTKIRFVAFDGVAARFRAAFNLAILFIYCRAHAL
jgi:hypothetical protein